MRFFIPAILVFVSLSALADDNKPIAGCYTEKARCNATRTKQPCLIYRQCIDQLQLLRTRVRRAVTDRDVTTAEAHERLRKAGAFTDYSRQAAQPLTPAEPASADFTPVEPSSQSSVAAPSKVAEPAAAQ